MVKKEIIKEELKRILDRDGVLKPKIVVDEARDESSVLHEMFDWDDSSAAEKYRLNQAMHIITSVTVTYKDKEVDVYYNVQLETVEQSGYYTGEQIMSDKDKYQEVLRMAIVELKYFEKKYEMIKELKKVFKEIQSL